MTLMKWTIARRFVQLAVIALITSPRWGGSIFSGNLSAGELLGVRLADPLAFLQATLASRLFVPSFLGAALLVTAVYFAAGGRTFCGWVCPVYLATEMSDKLRRCFGSGCKVLPLSGTRWALGGVLLISLATSLPVFEILSPIGVVTRAMMFKSWLPMLALLAVMVVEVFAARRVWCRSLCPVGGFYSLLGRFSPVRIGFNRQACTGCGECSRNCPVEEVLEPALRGNAGQILSGDCTRCGVCIDVCQTGALNAKFWYS